MNLRSLSVPGRAAALAVLLAAACGLTAAQPRTTEPFTASWRFHVGDVPDGQNPSLDDAQWRLLGLPHDWSIEGHFPAEAAEKSTVEFSVVKGEWKFAKGDDPHWKDPDLADSAWQTVRLPANWEAHSNYTQDNVYGWYRRTLTVPADLQGKDILLNVGKIDDADETYVNGVKVGGLGSFPPNYVTAWDIVRHYRVPREILHYGGQNSIAVRVFDGIGGGGMYDDGAKIIEGPFESTCPGGSGAGYLNAGIGWYRKSFQVPERLRDRRTFIEFDGVYMNSDVWLNGVHLGNRPYGYSSFQYELTQHLKYGTAENVLAVRVDVQQPCSRWYSGAGIYRNVRLTHTAPVHLAQWGTVVTTPKVAENEATVRIETNVRNQSTLPRQVTLETIVRDPSGHERGRSSTRRRVEADSTGLFDQSVRLPSPKRWSLESPALYRVESRVSVNGRLVDAGETPFGIRVFEFDRDKGFFLNGRHVDLKGVCMHHDLGCLGTAVYTRAIERQLEIMKSMGCNAVRTSHNPPAPELLDLCDRMGFLVMDEAFDEWQRSKTMNGYGRFFDQWSERDLSDMVRRDRNHPSIILWSIGNEIPEQDNPNAYDMSRRLVEICRREDPTRPVTSACNSPEAAVKSGFSRPLDVFGINYSMPFYQSLQGKAKLVGSETASAVSTRGEYNLVVEGDTLAIKHALNNQCSSYDDSTAESTLKAVRNAPWVAGQFVWTGFDYIGEPSPFPWPSVSSYFGIVDLCGFPKDRYYLYQSQWTDKPMVHILPHWNWEGHEGKAIPVWCYSNCESVELFVNGKSLGEKKFRAGEDLHLAWTVPYAPGELKAVARNKGSIVCTDEVHTAGAPARVTLTPDRSIISADGRDLSFVRVAIVDREGRLCPNAGNTVKFNLEGEGRVVGVDNGNPISHEHYQAAERKAFHGLCLAVIRSTGNAGAIKLAATADGIEGSAIAIETRSR